VERAKIVMEGVVQKGVVYCEVKWLFLIAMGWGRAVDGSLRTLARGAWSGIRVGEQRVLVGSFEI